jgi:hypothetical protein
MTYTSVAVSPQPSSPRLEWEVFIDALDRAGQAGSLGAVEVPAVGGAVAGRRFEDLTSAEVKDLSHLANGHACRGDILVVMWRDLQWKRKQQRKLERKRR